MKKIIFICLLTFSMLFSSGCQKSNIINSPISEFNLKTLSESNRMYRDDVPILTLLENNFDILKNNKSVIKNDAELKIRVEILKDRLVDLIDNL